MPFVADLHIHSHYSRATSKDLDLEHLHAWAQKKGVAVVGTGDFTHPGWRAELKDKLVPAEPGLFRLRDDLATASSERLGVPAACRGAVRFLLSVEISSIYKKADKVRKVHNLVFAPDFEVADRISERLARLGNVASDGRPILGLDSRDVLEIALTASDDAHLIPAHAWTPWFSVLGAQSGFDAVDECFGDLAPHVFAIETGLSSDPAMNWRVSSLDRFALISCSDAHSPEKLGREGTLFSCERSYFALFDALRTRRGFDGTLEFFPEEGKYHHDGHRECGVVLGPDDAKARGRLCPVCGKKLTGGVAGRVLDLADRPAGRRPDNAQDYRCLVPLSEVIGEVAGVGPTSKRVRASYEALLHELGSELSVLTEQPLEDVARSASPLLAEAVRRVRAGEVHAQAGYDGVYGVVRVFAEQERERLLDQSSLGFAFAPAPAAVERPSPRAPAPAVAPAAPLVSTGPAGLTEEQQRVVAHGDGVLVVLAGPGTGKTRTLVERAAHLLEGGVSPRNVTALTFTRRAAQELQERLTARLSHVGAAVTASTIHALSLELLRRAPGPAGLADGFEVLDDVARAALVAEVAGRSGVTAKALSLSLQHTKATRMPEVAPALAAAADAYADALRARNAVDFDDLVVRAATLLERDPASRAHAHEACRHLFVDEAQDLNPAQAALVRLSWPDEAGAGLCLVGDPDQAIYAFRGASPAMLASFCEAPGAAVVALTQTHRCSPAVVSVANAVIAAAPGRAHRDLSTTLSGGVAVAGFIVADGHAEADLVAAQIEEALGGTTLASARGGEQRLAFHDVAVLARTRAQLDRVKEALGRRQIPGFVAADVAALSDAEPELRPAHVALLTLHAAKGLEFPLVFIIGCDDGIVPLDTPGLSVDADEERRLLYVGITRAKERLVLISARQRELLGRSFEGRVSPFLRDAGVSFTVRSGRPRPPKQLEMF